MRCILERNGDDELELITDMRHFNSQGIKDRDKLEVFWEDAARVLEMQNGSSAHNRRHASADTDTTNTVSFAPGIVFIPQLRRET
eukprot:6247063-Ditylum_brightwellii.AAC.1